MKTLSDGENLRHAVESTEPTMILSKVVKKMFSRYVFHPDKMSAFFNWLGEDIFNLKLTYFHKHMDYDKKKHINNLFIFIDEEYQIIGLLKGSKWDKELMWVEDYKDETKWTGGHFVGNIKKDRKTMTERAFHILMIEKEIN